MSQRALLIVDHGSRRPQAHRHLEWIAEQVRQRRPGLPVYVAHMELAEPSIEASIERCVADGISQIVVHPLFLSPGRHLGEDVPSRVEAAAARHPGLHARISSALGDDPGLAELILGAFERA